MAKPIITVVGSFAVGMTLRTSRMPHFGETLLGADFDMGPGGKGSNQAVATAKLGAHSYFAGIIGDDKLGEIATDLYAREGVDTTYLQKTKAMATGVGFIILNEAGENGIILDMGGQQADGCGLCGPGGGADRRQQCRHDRARIARAGCRARHGLGRRHGVRTILNPAPAAPLGRRRAGQCGLPDA